MAAPPLADPVVRLPAEDPMAASVGPVSRVMCPPVGNGMDLYCATVVCDPAARGLLHELLLQLRASCSSAPSMVMVCADLPTEESKKKFFYLPTEESKKNISFMFFMLPEPRFLCHMPWIFMF